VLSLLGFGSSASYTVFGGWERVGKLRQGNKFRFQSLYLLSGYREAVNICLNCIVKQRRHLDEFHILMLSITGFYFLTGEGACLDCYSWLSSLAA